MDLEAVRTFVVAADVGQFQEAADDLSVTQQAVSKRIAGLERTLGVTLFTRTARGAELTIDGQAFLTHARELLRVAERAADSVRPARRALRVDIPGRRTGPGKLMRDFHRAHPDVVLDVIRLTDAGAAVAAVDAGTIDVAFRALTTPLRRLPGRVRAVRVYDEAVMLLTGPRHEFADAVAVSPQQLAGYRIWMPGLVPGSEWGAYYDALAETFGLRIDALDPNQGAEPLLDTIADSDTVVTIVGAETNYLWPAGYDLRCLPVRDPAPVYPHSLIWRDDNPHAALAALREFLHRTAPGAGAAGTWTPSWTHPAR